MYKKTFSVIAVLLLLACLSGGCGREKADGMEFKLNEQGDSYTMVYYTDRSNVKKLVIPDTFQGKPVTALGRLAINSADTLEEIEIGANLTAIDPWGITKCTHLKSIAVSQENPAFLSQDGVLFSKDKKILITYPNANTAVYDKDGRLQNTVAYTVPQGVEIIAHTAFYQCFALDSIQLPDTVRVIEARAFQEATALKKLEIREGVTSIGEDAFLHCAAMVNITLPSTLRSVGDYAFNRVDAIQNIYIRASQSQIELGYKWYPTSAGRDLKCNIVWDYTGPDINEEQ